jgi:tRNA A37 N6-isopentenylltransferase MiaA
MNYEEIKAAWNAQADEYNQWDELSEVERIEFAAQAAADKERPSRIRAQEEVVYLKERIASAGAEQRRAVHEAVLQEQVEHELVLR